MIRIKNNKFKSNILLIFTWVIINQLASQNNLIINKIDSIIETNSDISTSLNYIKSQHLSQEILQGLIHYSIGKDAEFKNDFEKAVIYYSKASEIVKNVNQEHFLLYNFNSLNCRFDLYQFDSIDFGIKKIINNKKFSSNINNTLLLKYYNLLGLSLKKKGDLNGALKTFKKGLELADKDDLVNINKLKFNLYQVLISQSNFNDALVYTFEVLDYAVSKKDTLYIIDSYIDIADIYKELNNYELSEKYYILSQNLAEAKHNNKRLSRIHEGLGILFSYQKKYNQSDLHLLKAISIDRSSKNYIGLIYSINNYCKNKIFTDKYNYQIEKLLDEAIELAKKYNENRGLYYSFFLKGCYYQELKNYTAAIELYNVSLSYHQKEKMYLITKEIIYRISDCYKLQGNFKEAYNFTLYAEKISDTLNTINNTQAIEDIKEKYESKQKDLEIAQQKIIALEKDKKFQKLIVGSLIAIILFLGILSILTYNYIQTRKQLISKKEELKNKVDDLQAFNYSVSHDLRGPIARLRHHLQLLNEESETNSKLLTRVQRLSSITNQIEVLIDEIMKLSQVENLADRFTTFSLNDLMDDILTDFKTEIHKFNININISPDLGVINGDRVLLKQAFVNIISNAIKFVKPISNPQIHILSIKENSETSIKIIDNGIGLDNSLDINDIFKLFVKGNNSENGVGAGLAIVKKIIEKHNGKVVAEKNTPEGLSIKVSFPNV